MSNNEENNNDAEQNIVAIVDMAYDTALQPDADIPSQNEAETLEDAVERLNIGEHWDDRTSDMGVTIGQDDLRNNKFDDGRFVTLTEEGYNIAKQWSWYNSKTDDDEEEVALQINYIRQELRK